MGYGAEVHIDLTLGELLFVGLPFAVAVGWLSGRVLGVRRGWVRALVAGAVGWFFGLVMAAVIQGTADLIVAELDRWLSLPGNERATFAARASRYAAERLSVAQAVARRLALWDERLERGAAERAGHA